ncbi:hypothetical protein [Sphingomonas vulcanisoli]|uniref:hypothetical protein n=1 Tax=Sphingomonas vulcanisoli TaxID=1658060 RepID=UPI001421FD07|nr:hypothetical protein [Sphingomonas vulcanisoli]
MMKLLMILGALVGSFAASAAIAGDPAVEAPIQRMMQGFNTGIRPLGSPPGLWPIRARGRACGPIGPAST